MLSYDYQINYGHHLKGLLEGGLPVLVYSGDQDYICNWMGGKAWTEALLWSGHMDYLRAPMKEWLGANGETAGEVKKANNFTFLRLYDAGHMVPMDQPEQALFMLMQFIKEGTLLNKDEV